MEETKETDLNILSFQDCFMKYITLINVIDS